MRKCGDIRTIRHCSTEMKMSPEGLKFVNKKEEKPVKEIHFYLQ